MPLDPAIYSFAWRRCVANLLLQDYAAFLDEKVPDVRVSRVGERRQRERFRGNLFLRPLYPFCDVLDNVAVMVACAERHRRVVPARILPQELFSRALRFDEILPIESRYRAKARDTVRD